MERLSVVVVEDHQLLRELLTGLFDKNKKYKVTGQADSCRQAIQIISDLQPDVVLLDINMPDGSGLDAIPAILKESKRSKIVVLSMHVHPVYAQKVIKHGGHAYVTKNSPQQEILTAIDEVLNDRRYICSEIKSELSMHLITQKSKNPDLEILSLREKQVLQYLKEGHPSREIAEILNISLKTVQAHRHNIFKKLKVQNITALVNYVNKVALNYGVV